MTNRDLATLSVKLLGVYCLILFASAAPNFGYWFVAEDRTVAPFVIFIVSTVWFGLLGVILVWKSKWFVSLVDPKPDPPDQETPSVGGLQEVLFSVIGVVLVAHGLPKVASTVIHYTVPEYWSDGTSRFRGAWPGLASSALEIVIGVALFLGSSGLARIWRRIQEMNQAP